jgi:8-oxo-dGTP pyrophosphatase MutT (NUDIX family)
MRRTNIAGGVVVNGESGVVVVSQSGVSWSLPKGHVRKGENMLRAALREIEEETGIGTDQLEYIGPLGRYKRYKTRKDGNGENRAELKSMHMFLFRTEQKELKATDPKNPEVRWVLREEVCNLLTHPKDKEFFASILGRLRQDARKQAPTRIRAGEWPLHGTL